MFFPDQPLPSRAEDLLRTGAADSIGLSCLSRRRSQRSDFTPQKRVGYNTGDQWEPAMAADAHGHVYVLYPQYGAVPGCANCTIPTIALMVSNDNGATWQPSRALAPLSTGQFDPQIVVDPVDRQTVYASWLQNNKRDILIARSLDFGKTWSFSFADRGQEEADKPVLAVRGADVYVGFNHEEEFMVAASHDAGQTFSAVRVNPNAAQGSSLAGGATVDPAGNVYFGWTAYARLEMRRHPVDVFVSRSADGGRTWTTSLLDVSSSPPECDLQHCEEGYLGAQITLASDAPGALYALWNAGEVNGGPERIYFSSSTTAGATGRRGRMFRTRRRAWNTAFPQSWRERRATFALRGWTREKRPEPSEPAAVEYLLPQFDQRRRNMERRVEDFRSSQRIRLHPAGRIPLPLRRLLRARHRQRGSTHAVWGEGNDYKSPGSIWYTRGR